MRYVSQHLDQGEKVAQHARIHWIVFLGPVVLLLFALLMLADDDPTTRPILLAVFGIPGALLLADAAIRYWTTEFAVTSKRVIFKEGLIRRKTVELLLSKVESINVDQSILGRLLGFGSVVLVGTGGSRDPIKRVADPMGFRAVAQRRIEMVQAKG